jgi:hypothetical protein
MHIRIYSLYFINTVLKAMSIKAKDRYQTIAEFRKDLLSHTVTINLNKRNYSALSTKKGNSPRNNNSKA